MTEEQRNILNFMMENKKVIEEVLDMLEERKAVKDMGIGESIRCAGITWSKIAEDNDGNAYMLADKDIGNMEFGRNNDWRESSIRKKLNGYLFQNIKENLGADALVTIHIDLFSHDGLRDYGKCDDMVSLLTYDLYRNNRENIKSIKDFWWLSTPDSTPSGYGSGDVRIVHSDGHVDCDWCDGCRAVRPFFILKSSIFVSNN